MSNNLVLSGAQSIKQVKSAPIYTGRWSSGIWTNRSPYRDATTSRIVEKFYGPAGDALIAGLNVEISNKLTLLRRPGNTAFGANVYSNVDRFYSFRLFNTTSEQINVMIDTANALYSRYNGVDSLVWTKQTGAGQSYMQSVGNSLYWGDGVSNKKWLQSLVQWQPGFNWQNYPFLTTYLIDPNGNIQQLAGTAIPIQFIGLTNDVLTVYSFSTVDAFSGLDAVIEVGDKITFPATLVATFLENQTVVVTSIGRIFSGPHDFVGTPYFTANFIHANYADTNENPGTVAYVYAGDGTPISGSTTPVWSTTVPSALNDFQGGTTIDGTALWINRGNPVENWGIQPPTNVIKPIVNSTIVGWVTNTFYSPVGSILDTNGNLQQVIVPGTSGSSTPNWSQTFNGLTFDGQVTWQLVASAAMLSWQANTVYAPGSVLLETASGTPCLFEAASTEVPYILGSVSAYIFPAPHTGPVGQFELTYPTDLGSSIGQATGLTGFNYNITGSGSGAVIEWNTLNSAAETVGTTVPFPGQNENLYFIIEGSINIQKPGAYTFTITHGDGLMWGVGGGAQFISGTTPVDISNTQTAANGYAVFDAGTNLNLTTNGGNPWVDTYDVFFPTAGEYPVEFNIAHWDKINGQMNVVCNSLVMAPGTTLESGSTEPVWPMWTLSDAAYDGVFPNGTVVYPNIIEASGRLMWNNIGPATDFAWTAATNFTLPDTLIVDPNGNIEAPYESGVSGGTIPTFGTAQSDVTQDNTSTLHWINEGAAAAVPGTGPLTTANGGWVYSMCLYNTLDNTASNATKISIPTGNFDGAYSVTIPPAAGIQDIGAIDPQADWVCIFRSTDGQVIPFLIPGNNDYTEPITLPLWQYIQQGYTDTTLDVDLNNLIEAPIAGQNTPPLPGAKNLSYYLNRLWYSVGNVAYFTTGPSTPIGNGINGTAPLNYDSQSALVTRLFPVTSGMLVFSVSDIFYIGGNGTTSSPIQPSVPLLPGVGLLNYNALDYNGSLIGLFTTDRQFVILDPANGLSSVSIPIADQFQDNNGMPGQSWNPATAYVAWYLNGQDQAWYVSDGQYGWYRLINTPAPETGYTWSPFAQIVPGVKALQNIETTPGVYNLLLGPTGTGQILYRDITNWQDNGENYAAWAVIGSAVLAQPGQIADVAFVTTKSTKVGTPLVLSIIMDEALPYFTDSFDILKNWEWDPPTLPRSKSTFNQRFYMSENKNESAVCVDMQLRVDWAAENFQSELHALTVFGSYNQES